MEAIIKLQYSSYGDDQFNDESDCYSSEGDYEKALASELERGNGVVSDFVKNANKRVSREFLGTDGQLYQIVEKVPQNPSKMAYTQCICTLHKSNGDFEDVDGIVSSLVSREPIILPMEIDPQSMEDDFEVEFTSWVREHFSISSYGSKNNLGDDWVALHEPCRDVFLTFKNKNNDNVNAVLRDCKILGTLDDNSVVLYSSDHGFE